MRAGICLLALLVAGCAGNSGVYAVSQDTFAVTTSVGVGGQGRATGVAMKQARAACSVKGKDAVVVSRTVSSANGIDNVEVVFRCV